MTEEQRKKLNVPASKLPVFEEPTDFRASLHWKVFRIMAEMVDGWQFIADFKKTVTFFGSARFPENNKWYKTAEQLGKLLAEHGFGVITGGGPGIMEGGNRGAHEAGGTSVGLNIKLPAEQRINPYVNASIAFHYFFTRKVMLSYAAQAYVYFPGGFGTLDEFFELVTLIQTKKIATHIPVILLGREYWGPLNEWIRTQVYGTFHAIDEEDMNIYQIVDTSEEALEIILKTPERKDLGY
ncbi:MAG: TIGR00730 family Rossman fold protein [Patescibacteria group bacterium]|nr:TIGR00730 family Rossman fold protein [Patescibacteria group bacterium]MDE2438278.1 TIGR00730 family Rossman fold protein [Patescibacteria group bacterium]